MIYSMLIYILIQLLIYIYIYSSYSKINLFIQIQIKLFPNNFLNININELSVLNT
jgi:hypothetical protein